jgi:hypothetical protein
VTLFDIKSFAQKNFYGGQIITPEFPGIPSTALGKLKGFADLMANRDAYVAVILSLGWTPQFTFTYTSLEYTKEGVIDPPIFAPFTHAPGPAPLVNSMRVDNMSSFAAEISDSGSGTGGL